MKTNGYAERAIVNRLVKHTAGGSVNRQVPTDTNTLAQIVQMHSDGADENTARATTRRALGRLQKKGLVKEHEPDEPTRQNHWTVTDDGIDEARQLREALDEQKRKYGMLM